jgi:CheY-like chemotaxis protein
VQNRQATEDLRGAEGYEILVAPMPGSGAILDVSMDMRPVACAIDDVSGENGPETRYAAAGKFWLDAKKSPRHVLVVDDEPLIRWSVAESLSDMGFDVEQASDAGSALRLVTTTAMPYDIVVLDLRLPDMNDLSLLGTLRQLLPGTALILMTAFATPDVVADAAAMGAAVIHKPFELDELTRLVGGP